MRRYLRRVPLAGKIHRLWLYKFKPYPGSEAYWDRRYAQGGTSGAGSYDRLAEFKAEIVNGFVAETNVRSVIEFGCGDGNQLKLARYPAYLGFDVSPAAIERCRATFGQDATKLFALVADYKGETAEATLSLDVIFHLTEDDVYHAYMRRLFDAAERFVVVYSSDFEAPQTHHERRRAFSAWVSESAPDWRLLRTVPNRYPVADDGGAGSACDFFVYERVDPNTPVRPTTELPGTV